MRRSHFIARLPLLTFFLCLALVVAVSANSGGPITGMGSSGRLAKFTGASTIGNSILRESGTSAGVQSTHPAAKFLVQGGRLAVNGNEGGNFGIFIANQNGDGPIATFSKASGTNVKMVIDNDGNVGIGTTGPNSPLEVAGTIHTTTGGVKFPDGSVQNSAFDRGISPAINTDQIAILRWYEANQGGISLPIGSSLAIAFDGTHIWAAESFDLTKVRAADGLEVATFPVIDGSTFGMAFDGFNIWISNNDGDNVKKIRANDGAVQGTFAVGDTPHGIAYDGTHMWIANFADDNVTQLLASTGASLGTTPVGDGPRGVAFGAGHIWVANRLDNTVTKIRVSDASVQGTFPTGNSPTQLAFDGANVWIGNQGGNSLTKIRASDGSLLGTFAVGTEPAGVAFDGASIWVANTTDSTVTKVRASDGSVIGAFSVDSGPRRLAFDGTNIWLTHDTGIAKL